MQTRFDLDLREKLKSDADISDVSVSARLVEDSQPGFLQGLKQGFVNRVEHAIDHPLATSVEVGASFAIGAGLAVLTRNPSMFGRTGRAIRTAAPIAFATLTAADLGTRVLTADNSSELGLNLGSALFDYPVIGGFGFAGAKFASGRMGRGLFSRSSTAETAVPVEIAPASSTRSHSLKEAIKIGDDTAVVRGSTGERGLAKPGEVAGKKRVEQVKPVGSRDQIIEYNRRNRIGGETEGDVYSNGDGSVTKVFFRDFDAHEVSAMYKQLDGLGVKVPEILAVGKTAEGKAAIRMQQIGDGDHLQMQLMLRQIPSEEVPNVVRQYDAMARILQRAGIRVDWQLKNMIWDKGLLYLVDPSFIKPEPLPDISIAMMRPR